MRYSCKCPHKCHLLRRLPAPVNPLPVACGQLSIRGLLYERVAPAPPSMVDPSAAGSVSAAVAPGSTVPAYYGNPLFCNHELVVVLRGWIGGGGGEFSRAPEFLPFFSRCSCTTKHQVTLCDLREAVPHGLTLQTLLPIVVWYPNQVMLVYTHFKYLCTVNS